MATVSKRHQDTIAHPAQARSKRGGLWLGGGFVLLIGLAWWYLRPQQAVVELARPTARPQAIESVEIPATLVAQMRRLAQEQTAKPVAEKRKPPVAKPPASKPPAHRFKRGGPPLLNGDALQATTLSASATNHNGPIPSLAIDLAGHSSEQVARHYHLALAAQSFEAQALLGILVENELHPLSTADLAHYSSRGRSADGLENAFALRGRIATQSGRSFDDIGLLYLVPKEVDDGWIAWQRHIITQAGYALSDVEEVKAYYTQNLGLEAYALVLKKGQTIHLKGQL